MKVLFCFFFKQIGFLVFKLKLDLGVRRSKEEADSKAQSKSFKKMVFLKTNVAL